MSNNRHLFGILISAARLTEAVVIDVAQELTPTRAQLRHLLQNSRLFYLSNCNLRQKVSLFLEPRQAQSMFGLGEIGISKKVMQCDWWNFESIIHFDMIENNRVIDAELYFAQLERVYEQLAKNFIQQISRVCCNKEVLPHIPPNRRRINAFS